MRRRLLSSFASAALLTFATSAHAEPLAARIVRLLDTPGRLHPMGDRLGRVPVTVALPKGVSAASLGLMPVAPGFGAVRLSPDTLSPFVATHPDLPLAVTPRLKPLLDQSGKWTRATQFRAATDHDGAGTVVGVIDTGIDIMHPDFRDANGKTRIAWLFTGGAPRGLHPDLEKKYGCTDPDQTACAIFSADDINKMIEDNAPGVRDPEGHGTHVASIAAGNGGLMVSAKPRFVGMAPGATLVVAAPTDGSGFYDADILNAARFVFDCADSMDDCDAEKPSADGTTPKVPRKLPVVLNLSVGGDYGSHDGKSSLEEGLSAFVGDDKPGRAIVIAAGNSGSLLEMGDGRGPYGIHTEVHVAKHEVTRVPIVASAAKDGQAFVWITFRPGDEVDVGLEGPGGSTWIGLTGPGDDGAYSHGSGSEAVKAGVVNNLPKSNPAISPDTNSAVVVWTGRWPEGEFAIVLRGSGDASLWVTGTGDADQELFFGRSIRQGTINVPASAPALLAVGCTINRVSWTPLSGPTIELDKLGDDLTPVADGSCYFSADGPTPLGVQKPEISAPGGFVAAAMATDADPRTHAGGLFTLPGCPKQDPNCAMMDTRHALAAGTSMSSPHVAGAIALLMSLDPTLTQARVTEVLQAGARRPQGHVPDPIQLGPGSLDVEGARLALLDAMQTPADPDLSKSWYTLSSAYARPDPTWPVWGTIQLRKLDGSLAAGIDGSKLTVSVDGGVLYQPLTKVRQGMWRFAFTGKEGDTGGQITVDVAYAGVSMGTTTLVVGNDVWAGTDPRIGTTSGACASSSTGRTGGAGAASMALITAAALFVRRRKIAHRTSSRTP
ncbi:Ser-type protease [Minicystis rosea]|nr:Ser-type protease [Minicystis rosea]